MPGGGGGGVGIKREGPSSASSSVASSASDRSLRNSFGRSYGSLTSGNGGGGGTSSLHGSAGGGGGSSLRAALADANESSSNSTSAKGVKKPSIPGFLTKTYEIFSNTAYDDLCGWGENGDTIIIKKVPEFSSTILPQYFKHSNFQSFVRQLNMYDFHKTVQDPSHGEFRHQYFKKGRSDLLQYIKRKVSQPLGTSSSSSILGTHPPTSSSSRTAGGSSEGKATTTTSSTSSSAAEKKGGISKAASGGGGSGSGGSAAAATARSSTESRSGGGGRIGGLLPTAPSARSTPTSDYSNVAAAMMRLPSGCLPLTSVQEDVSVGTFRQGGGGAAGGRIKEERQNAAMMMSSASSSKNGGGGLEGGGMMVSSTKSSSSKGWQRKADAKLSEMESQLRIFQQENLYLCQQVQAMSIGYRALKQNQIRILGVMQDLLDGGSEISPNPAIQKLREELDDSTASPTHAATTAPTAPTDYASLDRMDSTADLPPTAPPPAPPTSQQQAASSAALGGEDGVPLSRTVSMSGPGFWRDYSRTHSLGSIPSFGFAFPPGEPPLESTAVLGDGGGGGIGGQGSEGYGRLRSIERLGSFAGGVGITTGAEGGAGGFEGYGRLRSIDRLSSFEGMNSAERALKRPKISNEAQTIANQLDVLHKTSQETIHKIDSLEQQLSALFEVDDFPLIDPSFSGGGGGVGGVTMTEAAGQEGDGGGEGGEKGLMPQSSVDNRGAEPQQQQQQVLSPRLSVGGEGGGGENGGHGGGGTNNSLPALASPSSLPPPQLSSQGSFQGAVMGLGNMRNGGQHAPSSMSSMTSAFPSPLLSAATALEGAPLVKQTAHL